MSYTRTYTGHVSDSETVEMSYPASDEGGTVSRTVTITIPVTVTIHVDTQPFDREVDSCENHIDALTTSVVATEGAHVAVIAENARAISDRVTSGFFGLIRSEITQQMMEYRSTAEALFLKLNDMKEGCLSKVQQMTRDYERISDRYSRIFRDLDGEITSRVSALDEAAFKVHGEILAGSSRVGTLSTTATIGAAESLNAHAMLVTSVVRQRAFQVLTNVHNFLDAERQLSQTIRRIVRKEEASAAPYRYLPVVYRAAEGAGSTTDAVFFASAAPSPLTGRTLTNEFAEWFRDADHEWKAPSAAGMGRVEMHFKRRINQMESSADRHQARVAEMVLRLWNNGLPSVL